DETGRSHKPCQLVNFTFQREVDLGDPLSSKLFTRQRGGIVYSGYLDETGRSHKPCQLVNFTFQREVDLGDPLSSKLFT
ncbi:hypothetical protein ED867_20785, partial [Acinetobacter baumannii]